jgi:beta-aspartyl-peptidase (threonine type)
MRICLVLLISTTSISTGWALVIAFSRLEGDEARPNETEKAIRAVLDEQVAAWNKADLAGFMQGYWKSPKLSFSSGKDKTRGWDATYERYKKRYQSEGREMGKLSFEELEIEALSPDSGFVRGRFKLVTSKETFEGLFTLIFKKMPEGWRIVHDHTSV